METVLLLGFLVAVVAIAFGLSLTFVSQAPARLARKRPLDDAGSSLYSPVWFGGGSSDGGGHCASDGGGGGSCDGGGGGSGH